MSSKQDCTVNSDKAWLAIAMQAKKQVHSLQRTQGNACSYVRIKMITRDLGGYQ